MPRAALILSTGEFQQAGAGDGGAEAAEHRRAVKAAVLHVGRVGGDLTDHFYAEHVGFEQILAGRADMLRQRQRRADDHAGRMADMDEGVPVIVVEGVGEQAIGEGGGADRGFRLGAPDRSFVGSAEAFAIIERDFGCLCGSAGQRHAEGVEDMHLGIGQCLVRNGRKLGVADEARE